MSMIRWRQLQECSVPQTSQGQHVFAPRSDAGAILPTLDVILELTASAHLSGLIDRKIHTFVFRPFKDTLDFERSLISTGITRSRIYSKPLAHNQHNDFTQNRRKCSQDTFSRTQIHMTLVLSVRQPGFVHNVCTDAMLPQI